MVEGESRGVDRNEIFSFRHIMETGSEELREIIQIITNGNPPGIPTKEEKDA